ncbi:hypothetical protein ABBQ32_003825 [Trebouxia sp. C0010 RCD-2024]
MTKVASPADLTAFEGPDDWVSLYLDGVGEDVLTDVELSDIPTNQPLVNGDVGMVSKSLATGTASDRLSDALGVHDSWMVQDLSLPSLDDLLADDNPSDADGLFSGFHTLSNQEVDMLSAPDRDASHSRQHSNNVSGTTSEGHTHSDGSEGETSQTKAHLNNAQASHTQAVPAKAQSKQAADPTTGGPATANTGSTITASTSTEQPASPSLVGMTAAEVAQALGLDAAKQPHTQHGKYSAPLPAAQAPARKQANGRKKRGRDVEAAVTSSGASEQHASSAVAADMASRAGSPGVSSSSDVTPAEVQQEPVSSANTAADKEEEHKRMARMQRNRESAQQSRQRKRMQMDEVEQRCEHLKQQNSQLHQVVGRLTAETMGLKQQLVHVCQQTGHPLPPPPPAAMHPYGFGQMGLPMLVPAPKVPIQKMPPSRPAPASSHMPSGTASQRPAAAQSSGQPSKARKRAKQAAGASTVLLALFSFVVFLGPLGPAAGPRLSGSTPALGHPHSAGLLPGSASMGGHIGSGRVLMGIGSNASDAQEVPFSLQHNQTALALPVEDSLFLPDEGLSMAEDSQEAVVGDNFSGQGKVVSPGRWGGVLEAAPVAPIKSLVLRPSNKQAEVQALQGLKDLAPLVLYSQRDQGFSHATLPSGQSPWQTALPGTAEEDVSSLSGFRSPSMCKEVFQFEAQDTTAVQATQHVQRFLTAGSSMRGSGSIALPPVPPVQDLDQARLTKSRRKTIGCGEDDPGVVVSVMLPAQAEGHPVNEFTSLDQLYVVVLTPGVKYSTYSCLLPKPVLV